MIERGEGGDRRKVDGKRKAGFRDRKKRSRRPRREFNKEPLEVTLETEIPKMPFKADMLPRPTDKELYD